MIGDFFETPSRQVYKSTSKKIRVDTCDTRRQKSTRRDAVCHIRTLLFSD